MSESQAAAPQGAASAQGAGVGADVGDAALGPGVIGGRGRPLSVSRQAFTGAWMPDGQVLDPSCATVLQLVVPSARKVM